MVDANAIQQILSSPGAIAQDFDGSFFVLTDCKTETTLSFTSGIELVPTRPIFTPSFFEVSQKAHHSFKYCLKIERKLLMRLLESGSNPKRAAINKSNWEVQPQLEFEQDFAEIQKQIHEGIIEKAVAMTTERSQWKPSSDEKGLLLLNLLRNCPQHLHIYGHWTNSSGVIGASPEILFHRHNEKIHTMALAGTLPKAKPPEPPTGGSQLLEDHKELHEHQIVIDDLTEKLKAETLKISIQGPHVIELPHLFHLKTQIQAELEAPPSATDFDFHLVKRLHPSSALGLRSHQQHWHWLKNLKGHKHLGHFGAPFGIALEQGYLCLVAIRNLEWDATGSAVRAGCGIVNQSNSNREWQELWAKRESVKALLGLNLPA